MEDVDVDDLEQDMADNLPDSVSSQLAHISIHPQSSTTHPESDGDKPLRHTEGSYG